MSLKLSGGHHRKQEEVVRDYWIWPWQKELIRSTWVHCKSVIFSEWCQKTKDGSIPAIHQIMMKTIKRAIKALEAFVDDDDDT